MFRVDNKKKIVEIKNLVHKFTDRDEEGNVVSEKYAVDSVTLDVSRGDFITVLGHNGSGKSTLAKHINAILQPSSGTLFVNGKDTSKEENIWEVRQSAGMVFQNPDNQMVASVVEEDVGFGPENLGVPTEDIWSRVEYALNVVGMTKYRSNSPARLSGGQKQRVAIAGVIAMKPDCIVLDEPTSMLDPKGRKEVIHTLRELNQKEQVTIILITHHMDEVIHSDKVFVMNQGKIALSGTPREIFSQYDKIKEAGMDVPSVTELAYLLRGKGMDLPKGVIERGELTEDIKKLAVKDSKATNNKAVNNKAVNNKAINNEAVNNKAINNNKAIENSFSRETDREQSKEKEQSKEREKGELLFSLQNVNYIYSPDSVYRKQALKEISFDIYRGEFIGIIGHTGSGKSTLIQHLNGLNRASSGKIFFKGQDIYKENYSLSSLTKSVGLVFQYPEYQLFEATVLQDVCFGPQNLGYSREEAKEAAKEALNLVGIGEEYYDASPFELSGGQKRRAAIAGVLAMKPEILILDEPAAALDPRGRDEIFMILKRLHKDSNLTIVLVSHSMEDVAEYAERIIVMDNGEKIMDDMPKNVFKRHAELERAGLAAPETVYIMEDLKNAGIKVRTDILNVQEAAEEIYDRLSKV